VGRCPTRWPPCRIWVAPSVQRRKVWLTPNAGVPCINAAKTRKPLKLAGVPQTAEPVSAVSGLKFTIWWEHVEDILLLNSLFPIVDMFLNCEDIARQSCTMVPRWRFLGVFASYIFSEPRAAGFRHASWIPTKATPCVEVCQTSNLRQLRLSEEKKKERRKKNKPQDENIMACRIP